LRRGGGLPAEAGEDEPLLSLLSLLALLALGLR
jgi:hypothetical protein